MPYRYLEHKADLLIEATGPNFQEALESAAQGMFDAIARVKGSDEVEIEQEGDSLEDLVAHTLSQLLSESDAGEIPFFKFKVASFERTPKLKLSGVAYGKKDAPRRGSVKAVTYHELSVKEERGKVTIRVLLDV